MGSNANKKVAIWKFSQMATLVSLDAYCAAARYLFTLESAGGSYCRSSLIVTKR